MFNIQRHLSSDTIVHWITSMTNTPRELDSQQKNSRKISAEFLNNTLLLAMSNPSVLACCSKQCDYSEVHSVSKNILKSLYHTCLNTTEGIILFLNCYIALLFFLFFFRRLPEPCAQGIVRDCKYFSNTHTYTYTYILN